MRIGSSIIFYLAALLMVDMNFTVSHSVECETKDGYCYTKGGCGRTLGPDSDLPIGSGDAMSEATKWISGLAKIFTGLEVIVKPLMYMIQVGIVTGTDEGLNSDSKETEAMEYLAMAGSIMTNIFAPSTMEGNSAIAMQEIFGTNLYCKQQKVYMEESKYLTKMETSPDGGYPMFPIYPMKIGVVNGQCDVGEIPDFKLISFGSGFPRDTKCSFSFSAANNKCIQINIPLLSAFFAQIPVVEGVCIATAVDKTKSASKVKKVIMIIAKIAEVAGEVVKATTNIFFNNKLALDPVTLVAAMNIENSFEII
ncbi:MAG: hypothetical protein LBB24_02855, partial [Rickettsiales bacterium]|nr:hypothetical protein [Rickettsiales bacterium]